MQWESCLACSSLHSGYLVPKNVKLLFSPSSGWLVCMPGHLTMDVATGKILLQQAIMCMKYFKCDFLKNSFSRIGPIIFSTLGITHKC